MFALDEVERIIGYKFANVQLLSCALTHSSYVNEHGGEDNERLEFLGDSVLNFLVGEYLFFSDPDASEGSLSSVRAATVSRKPLSSIVDGLGLLNFLCVGNGVNKNGFSDKARSNIFEAIVGAVYLDGGIGECRSLLDRTFYGVVVPVRDYRSELQKYAAAHGLDLSYGEPAERDGVFEASVSLGGERFFGSDRTKHGALVAAARAALERTTVGH